MQIVTIKKVEEVTDININQVLDLVNQMDLDQLLTVMVRSTNLIVSKCNTSSLKLSTMITEHEKQVLEEYLKVKLNEIENLISK